MSPYDTIYKKDRLSLPGGILLPIRLDRTITVQYQNQTKRLSNAEIIRMANNALNQRIRTLFRDAYIAERITYGEFTENGYRITADLVCIENIAVEQKFEITN